MDPSMNHVETAENPVNIVSPEPELKESVDIEVDNPSPPVSEPSTSNMEHWRPLACSQRSHYCLNASCFFESTRLAPASSLQRWFYGYEASGGRKWICAPCADRVALYLQEVITALKEGKPACAVPTPFRSQENVVVDLEEQDDEVEPMEEPPKPRILVLSGNIDVEACVDRIIGELDFPAQKQMYLTWLEEQLKEAEATRDYVEAQVKWMEHKIGEMVEMVNRGRRKSYQIQLVTSLDLQRDTIRHISTSSVCRRSTSGVPRTPHGTATQALARARALRELNQGSTTPTDDQDDEVVLMQQKCVASRRLELDPTPAVVERPPPHVGDEMWVQVGSALQPWAKGILIGGRTSFFGVREFQVTVEPSKRVVMGVSAKRLAYPKLLRHLVPVGTRVVAPFVAGTRHAPALSGEFETEAPYYVGTIGETPSTSNRFRYLIFYDDGYAEYVSQHGLLLISDSSKEVWSDVYPDTQDFIRDYLDRFPERNLRRLSRGAVTTVEWNGRAFAARVLEVDASMVCVEYVLSKRKEWIYRGSNRFDKSLWATEADPTPAPIEGRELCNFATENTRNLPNQKPPTVENTSNLVEYEGKLIRVPHPRLPGAPGGPRSYVEHTCAPGCAPVYVPTSTTLRNVNPLLHPIHFGWEREIARAPPRRFIFYRAPCGLRLKDEAEVRAYVATTDCGLALDLFCFHPDVEPYAEFQAAVVLWECPDISYGKEAVVVGCVNSVQPEPPDTVEYTAHRLPGKDVRINTGREFLVCCDCVDDCADQERCACWKLTREGVGKIPTDGTDVNVVDGVEVEETVGYEKRRLPNHLISGIYECNQYCKCKSTCLNKVAQYPLRWKLQVFKTRTKGWAIRPLTDIPAGAFICVYAGQLLHENTAKEDGKTYGDEYFAELDYLETTEGLKADYEREVEGIDWIEPDCTTRELFGVDEHPFVMDAKTIGNIGRYMNHSCEPNVFVQNVFVDTHDPRFPWVTFFSKCLIRAGTELSWDYNYQPGSVQGKLMYCYCGNEQCRGRLL